MRHTAKFEIDQRLFPFKSQFVPLSNGATVHYVDEGDGPTLLLLHGNPTWSFLYRRIIANLRDSFRCIALDYPGFGLSTAPSGYGFTPQEHSQVVQEFVERLRLHDITLMVQDWGGPIGLSFATRHPELATRLVIGNTWAWPLRYRHLLFSRAMGGVVGRIAAEKFNGIVQLFMRVGVRNRLERDVLEMYLAPFRSRGSRTPTYIFPRQIEKSREFLAELEQSLQVIAGRPVLIVWGERDLALGEYERGRFEDTFGNHRTVLLDNAGHYIQEDAADEISEAIREFVKASPELQ